MRCVVPRLLSTKNGFVADVNAAADAVFDNNIKIKDRRLFVSDPDARSRKTQTFGSFSNRLESMLRGGRRGCNELSWRKCTIA